MDNLIEDLTEIITSIVDQIKIPKYSQDKKYLPKALYPTTMVSANKRDPPLEGGHCMKIGGLWTLKYEISSPKFYELLIKT